MSINRTVHKIDASGKRVGRLSTTIATLLRGKHKPTFAPHTDCGDVVEVYNTAQIEFTGRKWTDKKYYHHSGYPGGIKEKTAEKAHEMDPTFIVKHAVNGMLPDNKLRAKMMRRLKLHAGAVEEGGPQKTEDDDTEEQDDAGSEE